jgi:hypothetical protein
MQGRADKGGVCRQNISDIRFGNLREHLDRSHNEITPFSRILRLFVRQSWAIISLKFMRILTSKNRLNLMAPHYQTLMVRVSLGESDAAFLFSS